MSEAYPLPNLIDAAGPAELHEVEPFTHPAIYVMSLADWRNDRPHADWVSAVQEPEGIHEDIANLLERSIVPGATEWAVHDETGFFGLVVGDLTVEEISRLGRGIVEHGEAFARWVGANMTEYIRESANGFEAAYCGQFESMEDFATKHLGRVPGLPVPDVMIENLEKSYYFAQSETGMFAYRRTVPA